MEDKRKDLKAEKQRQLLEKVVAKLARQHPSFYYLPTVEIAAKIEQYLSADGNLTVEEKDLTRGLGRRQIQILLSLH